MAGFNVYAISPYTYVYADNKGSHKQGKAYPPRVLKVKNVWQTSWYEIEDPGALDRPIDRGKYPAFWVRQAEVGHIAPQPEPDPEPEPIPGWGVSDEQAANAIVILLKWLKQ